MRFALATLASAIALGCAPSAMNSSDAPVADAADAIAFQPAAHPSFPSIDRQAGGRTLSHVQLVTITFDGYPYRDHVEAFGDDVGRLDWLAATGHEYGLESVTPFRKISIPISPPTRVTGMDVETFLGARIADGTLPAPATDGSIVYGVYYPSGTTALNAGYTVCRSFNGYPYGGYHDESAYQGTAFPFFVVGTCGASPNTPDGLTLTASHELLEIVTDPFPRTAPAYELVDTTLPWTFMPGEVGDVCYHLWTRERGYLLQRVWSNAAATAATGSPCVPAPAGAYYNVTSSPSEVQTASPGDTVTFTLHGWSSAAVDDWHLAVAPYGTFQPRIHVDVDHMNNGGTATVTLSVPTTALSGQIGIGLVTSSRSTDDFNQFPIAVYVP